MEAHVGRACGPEKDGQGVPPRECVSVEQRAAWRPAAERTRLPRIAGRDERFSPPEACVALMLLAKW